MKHITAPTAQSAVLETAQILIHQLASNPSVVLGLATGNTMRPVYRAVIDLARDNQLSFKGITSFNLDEYIGLRPDHPALFARYMRDNFTAHINMDKKRFYIPNGQSLDPAQTAKDYEAAITVSGGISLQLLGVGSNGHIGFNEPGSPRNSRTRIVTLSEQTRLDNFGAVAGDDIPTHAISMGIASILSARALVLLATGASKAEAVKHIIAGREDPAWPCSYLYNHADFTLITDPAARGEN